MQIAEDAAIEIEQGVVGASLKTLNESTALCLKIGKEFGFTPLSRKQIPQPKKTSEGKLRALKSIK